MIKQYLTYSGAIILVLVLAYSHIKAYKAGAMSIQVEFDAYMELINDQVQKAKDEKLRIESEQRSKLDKAKLDYADSSKRLSNALERLRKSESMLWTCTLPLAGSSSSTMSGAPESTSRTANTIEASTGARSFNEFYENAMIDTLQCSKLIKFVTENINNLPYE